MTVKAPFKKITTEEQGIMAVFGDGELVGIIYNDIKTHAKRCFKVEEMGIEEIAGLMERDDTIKTFE